MLTRQFDPRDDRNINVPSPRRLTLVVDNSQKSRINKSATSTELTNRGIAYYDKGDLDLAIADYTEAIRVNRNYAEAFYNRGIAFHDKGELDLAITDYTEAIKLNIDYAGAFNNRGRAYSSKGDLDLGIADYTDAIRLDPQASGAYNNRGNAYAAKGNLDLAIVDSTEAIRLAPTSALALCNRAGHWLLKGNYEHAITDATDAIGLDPTLARAYILLGGGYFEKGDFNGAMQNFNKAIEFDPQSSIAFYNRGLTFLRWRIPNLDDLGKAIQLNPNLIADVFEAWQHYRLGPSLRDRLSNARFTNEQLLDALKDRVSASSYQLVAAELFGSEAMDVVTPEPLGTGLQNKQILSKVLGRDRLLDHYRVNADEPIAVTLAFMSLKDRQEFLNLYYPNRKSWVSVRSEEPTPAELRAWADQNFSDRKELGLVISDLQYLDKEAYLKVMHWRRPLSDKEKNNLMRRIGFPQKRGKFSKTLATFAPTGAEVFRTMRTGDYAKADRLARRSNRARQHLQRHGMSKK